MPARFSADRILPRYEALYRRVTAGVPQIVFPRTREAKPAGIVRKRQFLRKTDIYLAITGGKYQNQTQLASSSVHPMVTFNRALIVDLTAQTREVVIEWK